MRKHVLASMVLLAGVGAAQAQSWPMVGNPNFGPAQAAQPIFVNPHASNPYATPALPTSGPRVYYGEFPNAAPVTMPAPMRPSPMPMQFPPAPTPMPSAPMPSRPIYYYPAAPAATMMPYNYYPFAQSGTWTPEAKPARRATGYPISVPESAPDPVALPKRDDLPFHRPTKDCWWVSGEYVGTLIRPMRLFSPLVTTGTIATPTPGVLGQPGTAVLLGGDSIHFGWFSGIRLGAGMFLDDSDRVSVEIVGSWMPRIGQGFTFASDGTGNPVIARPVFNVADAREGAFVNSVPGNVAGAMNVDFQSQMWGIELNGRYHVYWWERLHADALVGFRFQSLRESMHVQELLTPIAANFLTFRGAAVNAPNQLADEDGFHTTNQFYGAQIGGRLAYEYNWLTLSGFAKLGLGGTVQHSSISGATVLLSPAGNQVAAGGVLAQTSNMADRRRTVFGLLPEFGLNAGFDLCENVRLNLGYSFLMWNRVVRPTGQIDRNVNPNQAPSSVTFGNTNGPTSPGFRFNDELFYTHNFSIGFEVHY